MRNQSGQSLIELMVSVVIITTSLSGIVALFPYIIQKNVRIQMQNKAINLAQNELERLRALEYYNSELDALPGPEGMSSTKAVEDYLIRIAIKYIDPKSGKAPNVYPYDVSQDTGLKEVAVSVKRKDNVGSQINLLTYFSKAKPGRG